MKRIAIYDRAATIESGTIEAHTAIQENLIARLPSDCVLVGRYCDYGFSGTNANRPEYQRLIADCRAGKIDCIHVQGISRFYRNINKLVDAVNELSSYGVDVYFEREGIHSNDVSEKGRIIFSISIAFLHQEQINITQNIRGI